MPNDRIEPPFDSDRAALVELYLRVIGAWSPSERCDRRIDDLVADVGWYLGVPDDD